MASEMKSSYREKKYLQRHVRTLWTSLTILPFGFWLIASPVTFGYADSPMLWSDVCAGMLLILFSLLSLHPRQTWARWANCLVGAWLQFAPIALWAESPAAYVNGTLVGVWVIALSVLIPGIPGAGLRDGPGPDVPPGWTYNPSTWLQRLPVIVLGIIGWFMARYLAAYQLGYISTAWDPLFGEGTRKVLESDLSKLWPISDAGLGALSYTFEVLLGYVGGENRWRTAPWLVVFFGILVVPLGVTHVLLVISQPLVVGFWCTLCLATAVAMLFMIPQAVDEVIAVGQFLFHRSHKESFWKLFWFGGTIQGGTKDTRTPRFSNPSSLMIAATSWGITFPWTLWVSLMAGIWLAVSPTLTGATGALMISNQITGALIITTTVIVSAEVVRAGRWINILLAGWAVVSLWLLPASGWGNQWNNVAVGLLVAAVSIPRGRVNDRYGNWDRFIV